MQTLRAVSQLDDASESIEVVQGKSGKFKLGILNGRYHISLGSRSALFTIHWSSIVGLAKNIKVMRAKAA
ncbi:MAG TPA: hypothetical protein VFB43_06595 [Terracidiphilus sp.]|nr:hypothetical protein [Terracidiphilus sp.]